VNEKVTQLLTMRSFLVFYFFSPQAANALPLGHPYPKCLHPTSQSITFD
jgi:hypothetical protein